MKYVVIVGSIKNQIRPIAFNIDLPVPNSIEFLLTISDM
jgi:hypothetical protein